MNSLIKFFMLVVLAKTTYSVEYAIENEQYYDVAMYQPVVFTCTHGGTIDIAEYTPSMYKDIVIDSILVDSRYTYISTIENGKLVHKVTLKNATIDLHYAGYVCHKNNNYCCMSKIRIPHRQEAPMCVTNYYTKAPNELTQFECISKEAYPTVYLDIITPINIETSYSALAEHTIEDCSYTRNETHVARRVEISGIVEDISIFRCEAYQITSNRLYRKVCYFESPLIVTTLPAVSYSS